MTGASTAMKLRGGNEAAALRRRREGGDADAGAGADDAHAAPESDSRKFARDHAVGNKVH